MSSVQDSVFDIIAKESGVDRNLITPDATLKDLKIESLDAVQIIFEIEDHFKITMPDRDPNFDTESVKGLVDAVEKLVAGNRGRDASEISPPLDKKTQAGHDACDAIDALCRPYIISGKLVQIIKSDPYVAGFLATRVRGVCVLASKEHGLDKNDAKEVMAKVLLAVYGSTMVYQELVANENALRKSGNEKFELGYKRGIKLMDFFMQKENISDDPDFGKAMTIARSMGMPESDDMSVPLAGLDRLWFGSYMEENHPLGIC